MSPELIAQVCYEVNRAGCGALGDPSPPPWSGATPEQRRAVLDKVLRHLADPELGPKEPHDGKAVAGRGKSPAPDQDYIFRSLVLALADGV